MSDPKDPRPPKTLAEFDAAIETLLSALDRQLAAIDAEADGKRRAAIERSGLRPELVERLRGGSRESSLRFVVHSSRMDEPMQPAKDEIVQRRGMPLRFKKRPMAIASTNSGLSIFEIAAKLGKPYSTVKSWGTKALPPEDIRRALAAKPYSVPLSAWKI